MQSPLPGNLKSSPRNVVLWRGAGEGESCRDCSPVSSEEGQPRVCAGMGSGEV